MDRRKLVYTIIFTIVGLILTLLAVMLLLPSPEVEDGLTDSDVVQDPLITPEIVEPIDSQDTFNSGNIEDEVDEVNEVKEVEVISSDDNSDIPEDDVRMFLFLGIDRTEERDKTLASIGQIVLPCYE